VGDIDGARFQLEALGPDEVRLHGHSGSMPGGTQLCGELADAVGEALGVMEQRGCRSLQEGRQPVEEAGAIDQEAVQAGVLGS
jgi:hypothetical protein